ncbi:hypothetical protein [Nocardioides marmorisolisilvae]|uniref:hypothetical protein n=1 Tax=Nocardioides marmorisolisilvae TaxID=1542737 RepID=UPI0011CDB96C|nr:hypothetical protein [Nocardioides marmorisolisilvae]
MGKRRFSYGELRVTRLPKEPNATGQWRVTAKFLTSGTEGVEFDLERYGTGQEIVETLNRLGEKGWELVGPPEVQRYVYKMSSGTKSEYKNTAAGWVERSYLMKREEEEEVS